MKRRLFLIPGLLLALVISIVFNIHPAFALVTGSYTTLTFTGATSTNCGSAVVAHGSTTSTTNEVAIVTVTDGNGTVVGGFSAPFIGGPFSFASTSFTIQPTKNPIRFFETWGGVTIANLVGDDPCLPPSGAGGVTWCQVGADGRVDGKCGDRVAAYCNISADPANLDVWGITNDSQGHRLATFTFADLVKAGDKGILRKVEPMGSVFAIVDANNNFTAQWFGGPAGATGDKDFIKSFTCNFKR